MARISIRNPSFVNKVILILLVNCILISGSPPPLDKSCKDVIAEINKVQLQQRSICINKLGLVLGKDKVEKSTCVSKCALQNIGLIKPDGSLSTDHYEQYLQENFPLSLIPKANSSFSPCLKLYGPKQQALSASGHDGLCKAYDPFVKCISARFFLLCSGPEKNP